MSDADAGEDLMRGRAQGASGVHAPAQEGSSPSPATIRSPVNPGERHGKRVITAELERSPHGKRRVSWRCDCGNEGKCEASDFRKSMQCIKCNGRRAGAVAVGAGVKKSPGGIAALTAGKCTAVDAVTRMRCWADLPCAAHVARASRITPEVALARLELDPE